MTAPAPPPGRPRFTLAKTPAYVAERTPPPGTVPAAGRPGGGAPSRVICHATPFAVGPMLTGGPMVVTIHWHYR